MAETSASVVSTPALLAPVAPGERIEILDILRGVALFGVLWMNLPWVDPETPSELGFWALVLFVVRLKAYAMFAILFGLGIALQMERAQARGAPVVVPWLRRAFGLLVIGIVHSISAPPIMDILRDYAMCALLLLLFRTCSPRRILLWVGITLAIFFATREIHTALSDGRRPDPWAERQAGLESREEQMSRQARREARPSYAYVLSRRAAYPLPWVTDWETYVYQTYRLHLILLGFCVGRRRIVQNLESHTSLLKKIVWWSLCIGVLPNIVDPVGPAFESWGLITLPGRAWIARTIAQAALACAYLSGITLAARSERVRKLLAPLGYVGRMALTSYLLQSTIITILTFSLDLHIRTSVFLNLVLALVIFAAQVPLSRWWLHQFRFGPAEWLWRSVTYWKLQPMRSISHG